MKKLYTTSAYKLYHKRCCERIMRHIRKRKRQTKRLSRQNKPDKKDCPYKKVLTAPQGFSFLESMTECAQFFARMRSSAYIHFKSNQKSITIDLAHVNEIDFASVMTLTAICEELKCEGINVYGNFPENSFCRQFLIDSGFLNKKYDAHRHPYRLQSKTEFMSLERGQEKLRIENFIKIRDLTLHISRHLLGEEKENLNLTTLLKEICGNSIEWSSAYKRQWTMGAKFEKDKVVLVAIDLGQGILNSLHRKFTSVLEDLMTRTPDFQILAKAFDRKYGSASRDENRNKGLPSIKKAYEDGFIKKLTVITNNAGLHFDNPDKNLTFAKDRNAFKGTLYLFEIDNTCFKQ